MYFLDKKVEHKNYGDTLDYIEEGVLERIKHGEDAGDADNVVHSMADTGGKETHVSLDNDFRGQ